MKESISPFLSAFFSSAPGQLCAELCNLSCQFFLLMACVFDAVSDERGREVTARSLELWLYRKLEVDSLLFPSSLGRPTFLSTGDLGYRHCPQRNLTTSPHNCQLRSLEKSC